MVRFVRFSYYKIANRTAPCGAVQCTITCGVVRLCHFTGDFGAIFTICTVYAVWWTPLNVIVFKWIILTFSKWPQSCYYMLNHVYWKNKKSTTASKSIININTDNKKYKNIFFLKAYNYIVFVSIGHQFFLLNF